MRSDEAKRAEAHTAVAGLSDAPEWAGAGVDGSVAPIAAEAAEGLDTTDLDTGIVAMPSVRRG